MCRSGAEAAAAHLLSGVLRQQKRVEHGDHRCLTDDAAALQDGQRLAGPEAVRVRLRGNEGDGAPGCAVRRDPLHALAALSLIDNKPGDAVATTVAIEQN